MAKPGFYGVRGGPRPGVYTSWPEAQKWSSGKAGAHVKKFATHAEAAAFSAPNLRSAAATLGLGRTYLDCPFAEKDEAKALGAKWDPEGKAWYVPEQLALKPFERWLPDYVGALERSATSAASAKPEGKLKRSRKTALDGGGSASLAPPTLEQLLMYTDGSCAGNRNVETTDNPAGWGVCIIRAGEAAPLAELYGPVVTDREDPDFIGAEVCSNNTGELSAICMALYWLQEERQPGSVSAIIRYDSKYAANIASGQFKAHKNKELAAESRRLFHEVSGAYHIAFEHVKGHSGEQWNERADALANLGATGRRWR
eukprot:scaffold191706_cov30-Tisochrysis_lutea.AAC.1